jgi:hypothetical protein
MPFLQVVGGDASSGQRFTMISFLRECGAEGIGAVGGDDPPCPRCERRPHQGRYTPGSNGDDRTALQGITALAAALAPRGSRGPTAVAGAVHDRVAPAVRDDDRRGHAAVDLRAVGRRRGTGVAARPTGSRARRPRNAAGPSGTGSADAHRAGSCRSSSRRRCSRSRSRPSSPASTFGRSLGRACGLAPLGPTATIGSKLLPLAPRRASRLEVEREVALGRAVGERRQHARERVVGDRARGADARDLGGLLDRRSRSTSSVVATSSWREPLGDVRCCAQVTAWPRARPRRTAGRGRAPRAAARRRRDLDPRVDPAAASCSPTASRSDRR